MVHPAPAGAGALSEVRAAEARCRAACAGTHAALLQCAAPAGGSRLPGDTGHARMHGEPCPGHVSGDAAGQSRPRSDGAQPTAVLTGQPGGGGPEPGAPGRLPWRGQTRPGARVCGQCAARRWRCALPAAGGPLRAGHPAHHRRPAFPPGPRARRPAPRDGRSAGTRLPGAAARAGAAPWLQFWLQFTRVQGMPGGFTCPGQDARGPERTAEPRTLIRGSEFDPLTPHLRRRSFRGSCRGTVRGAAHARSVCGLFPWPSSLVTQSDYRQLAARLRVWAAR
jgi:hypothetical protein